MPKKLVSEIILTFLLVGMLTFAFNIQPVKTQSEGELLFFDDFDDGVADGWTVPLGNFEVIDGEYYTENDSGEKSITTVDDLTCTDCIIEVNLRFRNTEAGFRSGIVFRYTDNAHHYVLYVSAETTVAEFCMFTPGDTHWGHTIDGVLNRSVVIDYNTDYLLRVCIQGDAFTGFLNGQKILSVTDGNYTSGQVGLRAQRSDIFFDNFTVYSIPKTVHVDDDNTSGPWDGTLEHPYQNITSGIKHASAGDTIFVYNGTYYENVVVNKTLALVGEEKVTTIIDGNGTFRIVDFTASPAKISGFTIRNGRTGIHPTESYTTVTNNIITKTTYAIERWETGGYLINNTIEGNDFVQNKFSIASFIFDHNRIAYNNISSSITQSHGIYVWFVSRYNVIIGNNINTTYYTVGLGGNDGAVRDNVIICNNFYGPLSDSYAFGSMKSNFIYHNNFFNTFSVPEKPYQNTWDDGYPSGGNYWSSYEGNDFHCGPYQNKTGSDGIGDTPFVGNEDNQDRYPLMNPWSTPFSISMFSPQNKTYYSNSIPLTFVLSKPASWIGYSLDNQSNITLGGNTIIDVEDGPHQIVLHANDTSGNVDSSSIIHFTVNSSFYDPWETNLIGLDNYPILDLVECNGSLYATSNNLLYVFIGEGWGIAEAPTNTLSLKRYKGQLVVAGKDGIYTFSKAGFTQIVSGSAYYTMLGTYNNTLYVGTLLDKPPTLYYCNGSCENPSNWHIDTAFSAILNFSGPFGSIDSFAVYDNKMYVSSGGTVYCYNGTDWSSVKKYDDVYAFLDMKVYNGKLYLATRDQAWRNPIYLGYSGFSGRIMEFDGINWTTILDHDYWIYSLETYDGKLYAGTANKIFTYNGTDWETSFHSEEGAYYAISMITYDGKIYAGMGNGYIFEDPSFGIMEAETITVPEFPSFLILPLFTIATPLAVIVYKKRAKSDRFYKR